MKYAFAFVATLAALHFSAPAEAREGDVHTKVVPITDVFVPSHFDSGSDAFLVVNGLFPHSCYKLQGVKVEHVTPTLHEVSTIATVKEGLCLTVILPFSKDVQLGKLAKGEHTIHFLNGDGTYMEKKINIED